MPAADEHDHEARPDVSGSDDADGRAELALYRQMVTIRRFEEHAAALYRDGHIPGFCHLSIGQEACAVGACAALPPNAVITSTHRGHGHLIAKGADIEGDPLKYRSPEDFARAQENDPIKVLGRHLGPSRARTLVDIEREVAAEITVAATTALSAPPPEPADIGLHVVASRPAGECADLVDDEAKSGEALRRALADALRDDPTVFLAGVDIGRAGGAPSG